LLLNGQKGENPCLISPEPAPRLSVSALERLPLDSDDTAMNFTLYGVDIPLWLLFSLALIGLATCVVGGTAGAISVIRRLAKPARRRLVRTPV
jgi:hypothetical protein